MGWNHQPDLIWGFSVSTRSIQIHSNSTHRSVRWKRQAFLNRTSAFGDGPLEGVYLRIATWARDGDDDVGLHGMEDAEFHLYLVDLQQEKTIETYGNHGKDVFFQDYDIMGTPRNHGMDDH